MTNTNAHLQGDAADWPTDGYQAANCSSVASVPNASRSSLYRFVFGYRWRATRAVSSGIGGKRCGCNDRSHSLDVLLFGFWWLRVLCYQNPDLAANPLRQQSQTLTGTLPIPLPPPAVCSGRALPELPTLIRELLYTTAPHLCARQKTAEPLARQAASGS